MPLPCCKLKESQFSECHAIFFTLRQPVALLMASLRVSSMLCKFHLQSLKVAFVEFVFGLYHCAAIQGIASLSEFGP